MPPFFLLNSSFESLQLTLNGLEGKEQSWRSLKPDNRQDVALLRSRYIFTFKYAAEQVTYLFKEYYVVSINENSSTC